MNGKCHIYETFSHERTCALKKIQIKIVKYEKLFPKMNPYENIW